MKKIIFSNIKIIPVFLIFLSSCAPLCWDNGYLNSVFLGYGDYVSPYDSFGKIHQLLYVYDLMSLGGEDQSFNQSFIPYYVIHFVLELFGVSSAIATVLMLCGLIFAAQFGFYLYIRRRLNNNCEWLNLILSVSGAFIYGASTYFISNAFPGHISSLFLISFFPFLIRYYEDFLDCVNYNFNYRDACLLILIIFITSPAFANIGNFIAMTQVFLVYSIFRSFVWQRHYFELIAKFFYYIILLLLINAWWMFSFAIDISDAIQRNEAANSIGSAMRYAVKYSTVSNIFVGLPEAIFHLSGLIDTTFYSNLLFKMLILFLTIIGVVGLIIKRNKFYVYYQIPLLGILLFSIFITKGPNPPFGGIFMYAWDHVPTFQIFRRPASKMYWAYWFAFVSLSVMGVSIFIEWALRVFSKKTSLFLLFLLIFGALFSVFAFSKTTLLKGISPTVEYYSVAKLLKIDGAKRVIMFPMTNGTPYTMTKTFDNYYGVDFFEQMLNSVILMPEYDGKFNSETFQGKINLIGSNLTYGGGVCDLLREVGISHVVFSADVQMDEPVNRSYKLGLMNSYYNKDLNFLNKIGSLTVFKVSSDCYRNPIEIAYTNGNYTSISDLISDSPTSHSFTLPNLIDEFTVINRSNYSNNWMLDVYSENITPIDFVIRKFRLMMNYICKCNNFEAVDRYDISIKHVHFASYGNQWNVRLYPNKSNLIVSLTYIKQYFFYLGLFISFITAMLFMFICRANGRIKNECMNAPKPKELT